MDTILVIAGVTSVALIFPIIAAVVAFRKGHPGWGIATIVSIFLAVGWLVGILAIIQPNERKTRPASSLQGPGGASTALPAMQVGAPFQRPEWEIGITPEFLDLTNLQDKRHLRISKEESKFGIDFASVFPFGFNLKVFQAGREYRFRLASQDLATIRSWKLVPTKSEKALARKQALAQSTLAATQPPTFEASAKFPLTFSESTYWWLWIPLLSWLPFCIPLVIPLGPITLGFSLAMKVRFIWEAALHTGENLPSAIENIAASFFTLGYYWVYRTYKATKRMLAEQGTDTIDGWTAWLLPFYIVCPAIVYMPLIRAMCEHWQRHEAGGYV
jgi:hypothetical protein